MIFGKKNKENEIIMIDSSVLNITDDNQVFINNGGKIDIEKIVIVKISTASCSVCKMFQKPLKYFEVNNKDIIETYELDANDENNETLIKLVRVTSVPTNLIFIKGQLHHVVPGADLNTIASIIHSYGYKIN